jgi:hypothetical protein
MATSTPIHWTVAGACVNRNACPRSNPGASLTGATPVQIREIVIVICLTSSGIDASVRVALAPSAMGAGIVVEVVVVGAQGAVAVV